jgi:hypothetical protein
LIGTERVRIFIGLVDVASYYSGLQKGFEEIGVEAVFVPFFDNRFSRQREWDPRYPALTLILGLSRLPAKFRSNRYLSALHFRLVLPFAKTLLLLWALVRCDVFIFGFATTLFGLRELPILRFFRKKLIFVFNGSDSRPPYISGAFAKLEAGGSPKKCAEMAERIKTNVRIIERYANVCINHPPQAQFHERPFINHCYIGHAFSIEPDVATSHAITQERTAIRILHAPSNPGPKGTAIIRDLISRLTREGHSIDYIELIEQPNDKVLAELVSCDFVIDELYSDIPLAGLSTEAAFFGKPAVVGGYAQEEIRPYASACGLPMTLYVRPEEIEPLVRRLLVDAAFREETGRAAQAFVRTSWAPSRVAQAFLRIIAGNVPAAWWHDPNTIDYTLGWGLSEAGMRRFLAAYVESQTPSSLHLADKPKLERKFLELAKSKGGRLSAIPTL